MSAPLTAETAACERCGCTWCRACPGGCSWDPEYWAQGRAVCSRCVSLRGARAKYHRGQVLRIVHRWALEIPPRPVLDAEWNDLFGCFTYRFPGSLMRIEEHGLEVTGAPDVPHPEDWS